MHAVRFAEEADLPLLAGIEDEGDQLVVDLIGPSGFEAPSTGQWRDAQPGFLLVAGRPPVGFAHVLEEDGSAHLEQLVVRPAEQRRGVGRELVEAACEEALRRGHSRLTLTTYRDVSFNRPWYERLGFTVVDQPTGVLARHVEAERKYAVHAARVAMARG
ncbi:GNAT family N-acetyltransferase [Nocardioides mangrovicus]|uniref:GNAT family N-acetyltransferase n=1 Tax=Nocardioides mangrovicus TaxID=2478913 RepID=A0A3L8P6L7_9ACTN|nr:GNAT family N-acetyltransferase [Nocardioides mangrovicus]RLV51050.1 GNAT family N-acetyltransferase [Nocardioides mangrovicus]